MTPLFLTDPEIAKLLGMAPAQWQATAIVLERSGLPRKDPQFGDRRYWPAVRAYLDRRAGLDLRGGGVMADEPMWREAL